MWLLANNHSPVPWGHAPALENMTPEEAGVFLREMMVGLDRGRPNLPNPDGSHSSELSATLEGPNGTYVNIPTIWNGQRYSVQDAIPIAKASGQQFPTFDALPPWQPWEQAAQAAALRSAIKGILGEEEKRRAKKK